MTEPIPTDLPTDLPTAGAATDGRVASVALAQRRILMGLLANIAVNIAVRSTTGPAILLALLAALAVVIYTIYWVVRLCQGLERNPVIFAIGVVIPVIGLLCLLVLNSQATTFLKAHGVKVGLLGAKS